MAHHVIKAKDIACFHSRDSIAISGLVYAMPTGRKQRARIDNPPAGAQRGRRRVAPLP